ncbi:MAG: histidine kinase [Pyrinomonadaceae bacterium]
MSYLNIAALVDFLGFTTGAALYAMLLAMVVRHPARTSLAAESEPGPALFNFPGNGLLFATAILGLLWNAGALGSYGLQGFGAGEPVPSLIAVSFAALGFLPAVVVHSALQGRHTAAASGVARGIKFVAYALSAFAGALHFRAALWDQSGPSDTALRVLTVGYVGLIAALFVSTRRQPGWKRAVWASALAVFAVSALHLSQHTSVGGESWSVELLGHHASIPLALAILYQDYRFAFADIFLKRALALLMLVTAAFGLYVGAAAPLLALRADNGQVDPRAVGALLGLWIVTALLYPWLRRAAVWLVDAIVLGRADYDELRATLGRAIGDCEQPGAILDEVCHTLAPALTAREVFWTSDDPLEGGAAEGEPAEVFKPELATAARRTPPEVLTRAALAAGMAAHASSPSGQDEIVLLPERSPVSAADVLIPTTEPPYFRLVIGEMAGGRRLMSDDLKMLEAVAVMTARRLDALRVAHERCEQGLREQEISKLATEAQLRALRAQVNPHFLFNALTTIGYLIKVAPDRALATLLKLTDLLRRVLRSTGEFVTLGEELKLIASYLDIERERFEERLRVRVDVPDELLSLRLPSLLVQPLVENAIKHGITQSRLGGEVAITARLEPARGAAAEESGTGQGEVLCVTVSDTGVGASEIELVRGRRRGVGLNNIEERLRCYGGQLASVDIVSAAGKGTTVELRLPVAAAAAGRLRLAAEETGTRAARQERKA